MFVFGFRSFKMLRFIFCLILLIGFSSLGSTTPVLRDNETNSENDIEISENVTESSVATEEVNVTESVTVTETSESIEVTEAATTPSTENSKDDTEQSTLLSESVENTSTSSVENSSTEIITNAISDDSDICTSEACLNAADEMTSRMNVAFDPCEDFYEFACGKYVHEKVVPQEKTTIDIFSTINDKLMNQIRTMLSQPIDDAVDSPPIKAIKNLFSGCMDQELIEKRGEEPLKKLLKQLGGWPLLEGDEWNATKWSWTDTVARMKLLGVGLDFIVETSVLPDFQNSSKRIIYIDHPTFELDKDFLMKGWNESNVKAYYNYIKNISIALGANKSLAEVEAEEIVNFEIALSKICSSKESRRDFANLYHPLTIRELQQQHQFINWLEFFNLLLPSQVRVNDSQIISIADAHYFRKLGSILENTPKRVLANYLVWRAVDSTLEYSTSKLRQIEVDYKSLVNGKNKRDERWKECVLILAPEFRIAVGAKYIKEYFQHDSKLVAVEMVKDIQEAFREIIKTRDWMDETTKLAALAKLEKMSVNIAYPNELLDDQLITDYYKGLFVKKNEFFESALNSFGFLFDKTFDRLHEPVNKTSWKDLSYVAVVNAFYHPLMNYIMFPAGILQDHFFSALRPRYMNYAAIGFVIGHEITHGYDDMGNQFDLDGNLRQWWQNDTLKLYSERAQCIIEQYGNFTDPETGLQLNGINTQGENIADNGGVKEAYMAYQKWVEKHGTEKRLPGLNYSPNQLFWLSAAQTWCTVYKPEALKYTIVADSHSPGRYRVLGPFMNSKDFSRDFNCPLGSPMNPEKKCEVW